MIRLTHLLLVALLAATPGAATTNPAPIVQIGIDAQSLKRFLEDQKPKRRPTTTATIKA